MSPWSQGAVAKEAQHINKSLSFLEQVIIALGAGAYTRPLLSSIEPLLSLRSPL